MPADPHAARRAIDAVHAADPTRTGDGRPAELVYADRIEAWVVRLMPDATDVLRLAARCQHLERWSVPRASFAMDKAGYHAWRKSLYKIQSERCRALLLAAGFAEADAADAATWVSKTDMRQNAGTQVLEDAACLVFLEHELPGFAVRHPDYTREKYIEILRKTWKKMSPAAREAALSLPLAPALLELVQAAIQPLPAPPL